MIHCDSFTSTTLCEPLSAIDAYLFDMSLREEPVIIDVPALIKKGRTNTPTESSVNVGRKQDVIMLSQTARKPAAHDPEIASRLSVDDARELRDKLSTMIDREDAYESG